MGGSLCKTWYTSFPVWLPMWFIFISFSLLYAILTPPFMYPDEPTHLVGCIETLNPAAREQLERRVLELMSEHFFWERAGVESPTTLPEKFYQAPLLRIVPTQASKPLVYYYLAGQVLYISGIENILLSLLFLRLVGVFLAAVSAAIFGRIAAELFPDSTWQIGAMAIILVPQYVFMAGAVNPMTTAWITGGLIILSGLWMLKPQLRSRGWCIGLLACAVAPVTHPSALALAPMFLVAVIAGRNKSPRPRTPQWIGVVSGAVTALVFFVIVHQKPFFVRTILLRSSEILHGLRVTPGNWENGAEWFLYFSRWFWRSSVLNFGWLSLEGDAWIYSIYTVIGLAALAGWAIELFGKKQSVFIHEVTQRIVLFTGLAFMTWAATGSYYMKASLSQGRYLFPAWPILGVFIAGGLSSLIPKKLHRHFVVLLVAVACFVCSWSLYFVLVTGFYF